MDFNKYGERVLCQYWSAKYHLKNTLQHACPVKSTVPPVDPELGKLEKNENDEWLNMNVIEPTQAERSLPLEIAREKLVGKKLHQLHTLEELTIEKAYLI